MIKLEGIHFISHAFIQSCELTLVRISCPSHAEKKPNGEGNNKSIKTKIFQNYLLAYGKDPLSRTSLKLFQMF